MTLDEAIRHCLDPNKQCGEWKEEERLQLAEWLIELRVLRNNSSLRQMYAGIFDSSNKNHVL